MGYDYISRMYWFLEVMGWVGFRFGPIHCMYLLIFHFGNMSGVHISFGSMKIGRKQKYGEKPCLRLYSLVWNLIWLITPWTSFGMSHVIPRTLVLPYFTPGKLFASLDPLDLSHTSLWTLFVYADRSKGCGVICIALIIFGLSPVFEHSLGVITPNLCRIESLLNLRRKMAFQYSLGLLYITSGSFWASLEPVEVIIPSFGLRWRLFCDFVAMLIFGLSLESTLIFLNIWCVDTRPSHIT